MPQQTTLPNMPAPVLSRYAEDFIEQRKKITEEKEKLDRIGLKIVEQLKKENRRLLTLSINSIDGVERWKFEVTDTQEKLKCTKA